MSVDFWRDFIYADCTQLGGRIKGIQFSLFKKGPLDGMSTYICKRRLLDSDLKRGPGKENEMIKCAAFLIEQILAVKCKWMS